MRSGRWVGPWVTWIYANSRCACTLSVWVDFDPPSIDEEVKVRTQVNGQRVARDGSWTEAEYRNNSDACLINLVQLSENQLRHPARLPRNLVPFEICRTHPGQIYHRKFNGLWGDVGSSPPDISNGSDTGRPGRLSDNDGRYGHRPRHSSFGML